MNSKEVYHAHIAPWNSDEHEPVTKYIGTCYGQAAQSIVAFIGSNWYAYIDTWIDGRKIQSVEFDGEDRNEYNYN